MTARLIQSAQSSSTSYSLTGVTFGVAQILVAGRCRGLQLPASPWPTGQRPPALETIAWPGLFLADCGSPSPKQEVARR
jgi:hypothetical protein